MFVAAQKLPSGEKTCWQFSGIKMSGLSRGFCPPLLSGYTTYLVYIQLYKTMLHIKQIFLDPRWESIPTLNLGTTDRESRKHHQDVACVRGCVHIRAWTLRQNVSLSCCGSVEGRAVKMRVVRYQTVTPSCLLIDDWPHCLIQRYRK